MQEFHVPLGDEFVATIRTDLLDEAIETSDIEELARLHVAMTEFKRLVGDYARGIEEELAASMPDKLLDLEGLPTLELRRGTKRTQWDSEALFDRIWATGSLTDVKACLPLTGSLGWRTTALKALGLDPEEWCETAPGRVSVQVHETGKAAA